VAWDETFSGMMAVSAGRKKWRWCRFRERTQAPGGHHDVRRWNKPAQDRARAHLAGLIHAGAVPKTHPHLHPHRPSFSPPLLMKRQKGFGMKLMMNRNDSVDARPTMGSTGVPPVPAGVPPGGSRGGRNSRCGESNAPSRRLGGTPSRTGGTPVLPIGVQPANGIVTAYARSESPLHPFGARCAPCAKNRPMFHIFLSQYFAQKLRVVRIGDSLVG
jgi:hypothetical protein